MKCVVCFENDAHRTFIACEECHESVLTELHGREQAKQLMESIRDKGRALS